MADDFGKACSASDTEVAHDPHLNEAVILQRVDGSHLAKAASAMSIGDRAGSLPAELFLDWRPV